MRASYNWLKELTGIDTSPEEMAERLTRSGLEVESVTHHGRGLDGIVIAEVRGARPHPQRDRLTLVTVFDGAREHEVVCGAPNVPAAGCRVLLAGVGARLPNGTEIVERSVGGVVSRGMLCSEAELDIGGDADGILVLEEGINVPVGAPAQQGLALHDAIFDVGIHPNRGDCLGHIGLAREVALAHRVPFAVAAPPPLQRTIPMGSSDAAAPVKIEIADAVGCPRYAAAIVTNVRIATSPFWLRHRLHLLSVRALSNVVDTTNYVMLERGHPTHAFDIERVRDRRIVVRRAKKDERMRTLDGVERSFLAEDLLICDGQGPVAVAGVMGGGDSEIHAGTKHVLIECAYFDPRSVRRTARRLGLHTEASHRFERAVDPEGVHPVLQRIAGMLEALCNGSPVANVIDAYPAPIVPRVVNVRPSRVERLLGMRINREEIERTLSGIGCDVSAAIEDRLDARIPTHRSDLVREVDLIEEIVRAHGYDQIPSRVPEIRPSVEGTPPLQAFVRQLKEHAAAIGLYEAINLGFVSKRDLELARVSTEAIPLQNPLSEERSVMRTSLLPGLVGDARRAQRRQVERVALYEIGHTFHPSHGQDLPIERRALGLLFVGRRREWFGEGALVDFYDAKGAVEAILGFSGADGRSMSFELMLASPPFLHPRRAARILFAGSEIGVLGELHPDVVDGLELVGPAVYADIDVEALFVGHVRAGAPQATPLPKFPSVVRDIAMVVRDEHTAGAIAETLKAASGGLAESVSIFDVYRGNPVPEGHKSMAFRVVYRDPSATLTDARIDEIHANLARAAQERFQASLR